MENKRVTNTAKFILNIWNIGIFGLVWFNFYNQYTFNTFLFKGGIISTIIYIFIYTSLCNLYKAHRIASSGIGETVFSQMLSFGIADLIMYIECCLVFNRYVNIVPGMISVILQILGTVLIVTFTKRYIINFIPAKKTLLLYGKENSMQDVIDFQNRLLDKYNHLFTISSIKCEDTDYADFLVEGKKYEAIILYELSSDIRGKFIAYCVDNRKAFYITPTIEDIMFQGCEPKHLLDTPLMKYDYRYENRRSYLMKRVLDISLSVIILCISFPFFLVIALLIKAEDRGPVFFKQKRCTKNGKVFEILKFRSMVVDAEKNGVVPCTKADMRITRIGRILRKYKLDEIPQFINVLKGEMSIVGPRPERVEHVEKYIREVPEFAYRMKVLGGLTGYAQIYGKYDTSAYDKLRLDLLYIENQSLVLDLKLILLTIKILFLGTGMEGFEKEKSRKLGGWEEQVIIKGKSALK